MHFVDIWQGALTEDHGILQGFAELMDKNEQTKAASFKNSMLRDRYIAVRGLLRVTLAHYLATDPATLQFSFGKHGKPALIGHQLYFNLSHSANTLAVAISDQDNIGVDIEQIKQRNGLQEIAERCFSKLELNHWNRLPESLQHQAFYQLWTKKEAFVKAVGHGIALGLSECEVDLSEGLSFVQVPGEYGSAKDWKIVELSIDAGFCGALVLPNQDFAITHYDLMVMCRII